MRVAFLSFDLGEYSIRLASALADALPATEQPGRRDVPVDEILLIIPETFVSQNRSLLSPRLRLRPFAKPRLRQVSQQLWLISQIHRWIRDFDPDIVHFQSRQIWFNLSMPLLKRYPVVVTIHDPREHQGDEAAWKVPQFISDFGYRRADQIIVHADRMKAVTVDEIAIPENIVHVVPMIALGEPAAQDESRELSLSLPAEAVEGAPLILFFGRIWGYKGLDVLIRAQPLITEALPEARIVIAGEGEDFGPYRRMMVHPEKFVVYNSYVSDEMRSQLFRQASVVVLPYIEATQSGVVPVAYTFGKPVVATTVGGLPEQVEHEQTGLLVPPRDERALADAVVRLLKDRDLRHRMGHNGKRKLEREWNPEVVARRTRAVYAEALHDKRLSSQIVKSGV